MCGCVDWEMGRIKCEICFLRVSRGFESHAGLDDRQSSTAAAIPGNRPLDRNSVAISESADHVA